MTDARKMYSFTVQASGYVRGVRRKEGDTVEMTIAQAKYENVEPAAVPERAAAAKTRKGGSGK